MSRSIAYRRRKKRRDKCVIHRMIMADLRKLLCGKGIPTYIVGRAESGSCYFKFDDPNMGTCRISDHDSNDWYGYRWEVRTDVDVYQTRVPKRGNRELSVFPADNLESVAASMERHYKAVLGNSFKVCE